MRDDRGDIDPATYEQKVQKLFASLPTPRNAKARPPYAIDDNEQPLYYRFTDKENRSHSYGLYQRVATPTESPHGRGYEGLPPRASSSTTLAPQSLRSPAHRGEEAYVAASGELLTAGAWLWSVRLGLRTLLGSGQDCLQQILAARAQMPYGFFSDDAFEAEKQKLYDGMKEVLSDDKGLGTPQNFIDIYRNNYLYGTPMREFRQQLEDNLEALVELEADDLRAWLKQRAMGDRNLAFVAYTNSPSVPAIGEQEFLKELAAYNTPVQGAESSESAPITKLIDFKLPAGKITREKKIPSLDATEWTLSNGMKVIYKNLAKEAQG